MCKTIYVSDRPERKYFNAYYTNSESTKYWATTFYEATQMNRRKLLWKPKAKMILDKMKNYTSNAEMIIDIGGGYGIFIEEFLKISSMKHLIIEPSEYLSKVCEDKGLKVLVKFLEDINKNDLPEITKSFVSFELFEHLHDPKNFLETLHNIMNKDDIFIFTTLSGMGVDIQTLGEDSKSISPPMHLNFFNPKSIEILLNRIGFKMLEVTTPGKLDINIMENNIDKIKDKIQEFISNNNLSSHMMIVWSKGIV